MPSQFTLADFEEEAPASKFSLDDFEEEAPFRPEIGELTQAVTPPDLGPVPFEAGAVNAPPEFRASTQPTAPPTVDPVTEELKTIFEQQRKKRVAEGKEKPRTFGEWVTTPAIRFPKFTINKDDPVWVAAVKEIDNLLISLPEFATTPLGVGAIAAAPIPGAAPAIRAAFAGDIAKSMFQQAPALYENWSKLTPAEKTTGVVDFLGSTALLGALAKYKPSGTTERVAAPTESKYGVITPAADIPFGLLQADRTGRGIRTERGVVTSTGVEPPPSIEVPDIRGPVRPPAGVTVPPRPQTVAPAVAAGAVAEKAKPAAAEAPPAAPKAVPRGTAATAAEATTLTPAFLSDDGLTFEIGKNHAAAQIKHMWADRPAKLEQNKGFVDQNGNFYTRAEAIPIFTRLSGGKKLIDPSGVLSEDLRDAGLLKHLEEATKPTEPAPSTQEPWQIVSENEGPTAGRLVKALNDIGISTIDTHGKEGESVRIRLETPWELIPMETRQELMRLGKVISRPEDVVEKGIGEMSITFDRDVSNEIAKLEKIAPKPTAPAETTELPPPEKPAGGGPPPPTPPTPTAKQPWEMTLAETIAKHREDYAKRKQRFGLRGEGVEPIFRLPNEAEINDYIEKWVKPMHRDLIAATLKQPTMERIAPDGSTVVTTRTVPPEVLADYPDLTKPPTAEANKIATEVRKIAATEGQRPAKEVKSELVSRIEEEIDRTIDESKISLEQDPDNPNQYTIRGPSIARYAEIEKTKGGKFKVSSGKVGFGAKGTIEATFETMEEAKWFMRATVAQAEGSATIQIPGDGTFTVFRNGENLIDLWKRAKRIDTKPTAIEKIPSTAKGEVTPDELAEKAKQVYGNVRNAINHLERQLRSEQEIDRDTRIANEEAIKVLRDQLPENLKANELRKAEESLTDATERLDLAKQRIENRQALIDSIVPKAGKKLTAAQSRKRNNLKFEQDADNAELPRLEQSVRNLTAKVETTKTELATLEREAAQLESPAQPTPPPSTQGLQVAGAAPTELAALRKVDLKDDPRLDMPGITRKVKPNSLVVQIRDLESLPIKDIVLKSSGDPMTDAQTVSKTINDYVNTTGRGSIRESLGVTTGPNGRAVLKFGISPNGMTWAPAQAWIDLVERAAIERGEAAPTTQGLAKPQERLLIRPRTDGMVTLEDSKGNRLGTFKTAEEAAKTAQDMGYSIAPGSPIKPQGLAKGVRQKWTGATDPNAEAGFINIAPLRDLVDRTSPYVKSVVDTIMAVGKHQFDIGKATDFRRSVFHWSAKLQRSFGEAAAAQKEIQAKVPNKIRQDGITNWIQAGGDNTVLASRRADTAAYRDPVTGKPHPQQKKLLAGYDAALNLTPEELAVAQDAKQTYDALFNRGNTYDVIKSFKDNYVTQIWNLRRGPIPKGAGIGRSLMLKDRFRFAKASTFPTFFDGEQAGYVPKTKAIGDLLPMYMHEMNSVIAARQLVEQMGTGVGSDGRPLLAPRGIGTAVDDPRGKATLVMPDVPAEKTRDYVIIENQPALHEWRWVTKDAAGNPVFNKSDLMVHPEVADHFKNVLGRSAIKEWYTSRTTASAEIPKFIARALDLAQSETKRTMLGVLTPFHQVQEGTHAVGHRVNPFFNNPKIDLVNNPGQMDAAMHGLMLLPDRTSAQQFMEGFKQSALVTKIPVLGPLANHYSEYLFHQYIPGIKYKTYEAILQRNTHLYGKELQSGRATMEDIKILSAEQANAAYGHLNYADLGRNPTILHIMRLGLLAPDFLEARSRFAGQAIKGIGGAKIGREQLIALATLALAQASLSYIMANITGGVWDEKDPFAFHVGNKKFTMRSVPEDIYRFVQDTRSFVYARLNPIIGRGAVQYASGVDWRGQKVTKARTTKELLTQPVPLFLRPLVGLGNTPLQAWEEIAAASGLKISRYSAVSEMYKYAHQWKADHPDEKVRRAEERYEASSFPDSDYKPLRESLIKNDMKGAVAAYEELLKTGHPHKDVDNAMKPYTGGTVNKATGEISPRHPKPFTGSAKLEPRFVAALTDEQRRSYERAIIERRELYNRFRTMLSQQERKPQSSSKFSLQDFK